MSPEEFDRRIDFILRQQAQFYSDLQRLEGNMQRLEGNLERLTSEVSENTRQIGLQGQQIGQLTDLVLRFGRIVERLAEGQQRADERLNILINVVERYFSNGSTGG